MKVYKVIRLDWNALPQEVGETQHLARFKEGLDAPRDPKNLVILNDDNREY